MHLALPRFTFGAAFRLGAPPSLRQVIRSVRNKEPLLKRFTKLFFCLFIFLISGCASQHSRSGEFKDVFDVSIQKGIGANLHASIFGFGLSYNETVLGVEDGCLYSYGDINDVKPYEFGFLLINAHANVSKQAADRHKQYGAWKLLGLYPSGPDGRAKFSKPYFTKFTVSVTAGYGVKLGINPGELLDLFLSFVNLSLYDDDIEITNPLEEQSSS
ncbi:MAG TPA: hypothetical protein PLE36_12810 [Deltaproteobacteria bacterium]|nr:hypothetical protein [Deltaproteobacteria bacterium]